MCVPGGDPEWQASKREFDAVGGTQGFLNGDFEWP